MHIVDVCAWTSWWVKQTDCDDVVAVDPILIADCTSLTPVEDILVEVVFLEELVRQEYWIRLETLVVKLHHVAFVSFEVGIEVVISDGRDLHVKSVLIGYPVTDH